MYHSMVLYGAKKLRTWDFHKIKIRFFLHSQIHGSSCIQENILKYEVFNFSAKAQENLSIISVKNNHFLAIF